MTAKIHRVNLDGTVTDVVTYEDHCRAVTEARTERDIAKDKEWSNRITELEAEKATLAIALVRATQQGIQRFGMENKPTLFHCFISAWENAFPLLVQLGLATEDESGVEILVDEAKVDALEKVVGWNTVTALPLPSAPKVCGEPQADKGPIHYGPKRYPGKPSASEGE